MSPLATHYVVVVSLSLNLSGVDSVMHLRVLFRDTYNNFSFILLCTTKFGESHSQKALDPPSLLSFVALVL